MSATRTPRARRAALAAGAAAAIGAGVLIASPAMASQHPFAFVAGDTLTVLGTNRAEAIALRLEAGAPGTLQVDVGDDGTPEFSFDRATFSRIAVFLRAGDDQFRIDQVNGSFADEAPFIDGGAGRDALNGGDAVEVFYGGSGADSIDGGRANDIAYLGAGADSFRWDPGEGSDIVEGQQGFDTLDFNGNDGVENMSLTPNGPRALFLRDAGNIRMDLDDVERLDLAALGGVDTVTVDDMTGTDLRRADIDLSGAAGGGDAAADVVTVNGSAAADRVRVVTDGPRVDVKGLQVQTRITGSELTDTLKVNTADGNDVVKVDGTVFGRILPVVDLGAGQV